MSFPIVYVTSVSQSWRKIRAEARKEALRLGSGSYELILQPPRLSHLAEKKWADELLEASKSRPLVVAAQAEVALLRLLRLTNQGPEATAGDRAEREVRADGAAGRSERRRVR